MKMFENIIIFLCFGLSYYFIEIMFRGYSHYSMFLLSGLCGFLIGLLNEVNKDIPLFMECMKDLERLMILTGYSKSVDIINDIIKDLEPKKKGKLQCLIERKKK